MKNLKQIASLSSSFTPVSIFSGVMELITKEGAVVKCPANLPNGIYTESLIKIKDIEEPQAEINHKTICKVDGFDIAPFANLSKYSGNDEIRPQLMGVFFDATNKALVSTDAHVLRYIHAALCDQSFILHKGNIKELGKIAKLFKLTNVSLANNTECQSANEVNTLVAYFGNGLVYSARLIDGHYPNWLSVIPAYKTGVEVIINKQTQKEMLEFCKDIANSTGSRSLKNRANGVFFNLDENTANIQDVDLGCEKTWQIETRKIKQPENCGVLMPILTKGYNIEECEKYFSVNMAFLDKADTEVLIFGDHNKALLIPAYQSKSPTPQKKSEPKQAEPEESKVVVCSVPKCDTEPEQVDEYPEPEPKPIKPTPAKVSTIPANETSHGARNLKVIDYSDKAIAVVGDTRQIKDELKAAGGRFNAHLKCGAGWIFSKKKASEVNCIINL